jgi:hypothetical protein
VDNTVIRAFVVSPLQLAITHTGDFNVVVSRSERQDMRPSQSSWSAPTSTDEAHARAAGRRLYNSVRHAEAMVRAGEVIRLLNERGFGRGVQAQIARDLGVHRSTISRDVMRALSPDGQPCPTCEREMTYKAWDRLNKERGAQQQGNCDTDGCAPSEWLQVTQELRKRGLLRDEDELPVEDDLGLHQ